jgi:signal transduction histidine kinase
MLILILPVIFLWIAGLGLLFLDEKNKTHQWYSAFCFVLSLGYFVALFKDFIVPSMTGVEPSEAQVLSLISQFISALGYRLCPYLLLNIGIRYTDFFNIHWKKRLMWLTLIPFFISFGWDFIFPKYGFLAMYITKSPYFWITTSWGIIYGLLGNFFLFQAYWLEKNPRERKTKLLTFLATTPTIPNILVSYLPHLVINIKHMWLFNIWLVLLLSSFILVFLIQQGIMGARLTIKRITTDQTILATSTGTSFLNHAIKNDFQVIICGLDNLKQKYTDLKNNDTIVIIEKSINHLMQMTQKIQSQIQDINLELIPYKLQKIVQESVDRIKPFTTQLHILVSLKNESDPIVLCDKEHLLETLNNIYRNAVDAMPSGGTLDITILTLKRIAQITISDSGKGISKQALNHVFEPFYTTKKFGSNYGLGLTYCYKVMKEHNGTIQISSNESQGTTVILSFPLRRLKEYDRYEH